MQQITQTKLNKYIHITKQALAKIQEAHKDKPLSKQAKTILDMAQRYFDDAQHFKQKREYVNAFACINYAHGWLDAGATLGLFDVHDSKLFTVD